MLTIVNNPIYEICIQELLTLNLNLDHHFASLLWIMSFFSFSLSGTIINTRWESQFQRISLGEVWEPLERSVLYTYKKLLINSWVKRNASILDLFYYLSTDFNNSLKDYFILWDSVKHFMLQSIERYLKTKYKLNSF
jgi:hypothetical protein